MRYTFLITFLLFTSIVFSQNTQAVNLSTTNLKKSEPNSTSPQVLGLNTSSESQEPSVRYVWKNGVVSEVTTASELAAAKSLLEALNSKEQLIRSNPKSANLPESLAWYAQAAETRAKLEAQITELEK